MHGASTTLALSKNSKNATPNNIKKHLETAKSESKYHPNAPLEGIRQQKFIGTPPETQKKRIWLTGTPVKVAKGAPKELPGRLPKRFKLLQDASKVPSRGVLEAKTLKS